MSPWLASTCSTWRVSSSLTFWKLSFWPCRLNTVPALFLLWWHVVVDQPPCTTSSHNIHTPYLCSCFRLQIPRHSIHPPPGHSSLDPAHHVYLLHPIGLRGFRLGCHADHFMSGRSCYHLPLLQYSPPVGNDNAQRLSMGSFQGRANRG